MRTGVLAMSGLVAALVLLGVLLQGRLFPTTERPATIAAANPPTVPAKVTPPGVPEPSRGVALISIKGVVERSRPDAPWVAARQGERLGPDERIRTGDGGEAVLDVGDVARVTVAERSQLSVTDIANELARVRLRGGRMSASVSGSAGRRLQVEVDGSPAVAETARGDFAVLSNGRGQVTVATRDGRVTLRSLDRAVEIGPGQQSVASPDRPPTAPQEIPPSLFLKVTRPDVLVQRERQTTVTGSTTPGAVVSINGVKVVTAQDGSFSVPVPLRDGHNALAVESTDALGREARQALPAITVEASAPKVKVRTEWK